MGRPFYVMEFVKGEAVTEYCNSHSLSVKKRLEIFVLICKAIQHVHQKRIVHRDIKPSNVLVTEFEDKPLVKVIDFGVAKAIDQALTDNTFCTVVGAIVGTFDYMSPEQAGTSGLDIDTRADVYSLGVLLFELLTGSTPLDRTRHYKLSAMEILQRINENDAAQAE